MSAASSTATPQPGRDLKAWWTRRGRRRREMEMEIEIERGRRKRRER